MVPQELFFVLLLELAHKLINFVLYKALETWVQGELFDHFLGHAVCRVFNRIEVERGSDWFAAAVLGQLNRDREDVF